MKFNESKEDYYIKIDSFHYDQIIKISNRCVDYIKSLVKNSKKGYTINIIKNTLECIKVSGGSGYRFYVQELLDEYFYVVIDFDLYSRNYKCDQLDGIKELLEDLKLI